MERKLLSLLAVGILLSVAAGWRQPASAALCAKCRDLMFVDSPGKCIECGQPTGSDALKLCPKCSAKRHQCEHCLAALTEKDEAASASKPADAAADNSSSGWTAPPASPAAATPDNPAARPAAPDSTSPPAAKAEPSAPVQPDLAPVPPPAKTDEAPRPAGSPSAPPAELPPEVIAPPRPKPINPSQPGTYTSGRWRYRLQIVSPGTAKEGRWGWLTYDDRKLPRGNVNDYYNTPWGPVFWVDVPSSTWGLHGWMPVPLPQVRRGQALATPAPLAAVRQQQPASAGRAADPPASSAAVSPARPRPGTLEINKSHNGQLAQLRVGHVLVIRLPGNPATGYHWVAAPSNTAALRLTVRPQYSPGASASAQPATQGTYTFTFQAVQPGGGSIRLYYVRPQDPSHPRDYFAVGIKVWPTAAVSAQPAAFGASPGSR